MGSDEVNKYEVLLDALMEFNPNLPSPIHCPIEFQHHLKLFRYYQNERYVQILESN